jgi:hypothetical protein
MIGFTINFYRDLIEIARRSPANDYIKVDVDELEQLLDWAAKGISAAVDESERA